MHPAVSLPGWSTKQWHSDVDCSTGHRVRRSDSAYQIPDKLCVDGRHVCIIGHRAAANRAGRVRMSSGSIPLSLHRRLYSAQGRPRDRSTSLYSCFKTTAEDEQSHFQRLEPGSDRCRGRRAADSTRRCASAEVLYGHHSVGHQFQWDERPCKYPYMLLIDFPLTPLSQLGR